ncbi:MAG: T9SS type A sorting domain-containing protein, partial [Bacteroidia bacterium]
DEWQTIQTVEGDIYTYTDQGLLPGRYIYQVSQSLPTGSVLLSNPAEVVLLPDGAYILTEQRVRAVGEKATVLWSLPEGGISLSLYDASGRLIHTTTRIEAEGSYDLPSPPAAGTYFLRAEVSGEVQTWKLIWQ